MYNPGISPQVYIYSHVYLPGISPQVYLPSISQVCIPGVYPRCPSHAAYPLVLLPLAYTVAYTWYKGLHCPVRHIQLVCIAHMAMHSPAAYPLAYPVVSHMANVDMAMHIYTTLSRERPWRGCSEAMRDSKPLVYCIHMHTWNTGMPLYAQ